MTEFKDLKIGDQVYILENAGTFKKIVTFNIGTVSNISQPYDDTSFNNQYLTQLLKNKLVDITITCDGVQKKLTVGANKSNITDSTIGLTVSTSKDELVTQITQQCKEWEGKIAQIENYQQELEKCRRMLEQLNNGISTCKQDDVIKVS